MIHYRLLILILLSAFIGAISVHAAEPSTKSDDTKNETEQQSEAISESDKELVQTIPALIESIVQDIDKHTAQIEEYGVRLRSAKGEDKIVIDNLLWEERIAHHNSTTMLMSTVKQLEEAGGDISEYQKKIDKPLASLLKKHRSEVEERTREIGVQRNKLEKLLDTEKLTQERKITRLSKRLQGLHHAICELEILKVELSLAKEEDVLMGLREEMMKRADTIAARLESSAELRKQILALEQDNPTDATIKQNAAIAEEQYNRSVSNMQAMITLLTSLNIKTSNYQKQLVQFTGELGGNLFDVAVMWGLLVDWKNNAVEFIAENWTKWISRIMMFIGIMIIFKIVAMIARALTRRFVGSKKLKLSKLLQQTLISLSSGLTLTIGFFVALAEVGVGVSHLLAGLGIAGFVIGFALQDTLSNFASGAMILIYRPFDTGDVVEAGGVRGCVNAMSLVTTSIVTPDNQTLIVPNSKIWGDVIRNVTSQSQRRVDITITITHEADPDYALDLLRQILKEDERVLADPEANIQVHKLTVDGPEIVIRPWCKTDEYWELYWHLTKRIKLELGHAGLLATYQRRLVSPPSDNIQERPADLKKTPEDSGNKNIDMDDIAVS